MSQIIKKPRLPSKQPTPDLAITFVVDHAKEPMAAKAETAKKYAQAKRLLEEVIAKYPRSPWCDLARDTLDRGFSVMLNQWEHNPKYVDRASSSPSTEIDSPGARGQEESCFPAPGSFHSLSILTLIGSGTRKAGFQRVAGKGDAVFLFDQPAESPGSVRVAAVFKQVLQFGRGTSRAIATPGDRPGDA